VGASSVQIQVQSLTVAPPANDACAGALTLPLGGMLGTNAGAANDYSLSGAACFGGVGQAASTAVGRDSVYSFTAPGAGSYSFRAQTYDPLNSGNIVLYSSPTCPSPGTISCTAPVRASNRQAGATNFVAAEEIFCQPMAAGEQTFLFVDETAAGAGGGNYLIEATRCGLEVESNNTPGTANALLACPMEGTITASEADFYSLGSPASGTRVFTITDGIQANDADFDLRVTNTADTLEYDDEDNNPIHGTFGPNIQGRALTGAASFIRVNHFTAGVSSEPYRLYTVLQPPGVDPFGSSSSPELNNAGNNTLGGAESAANYYYNGFLNATNDLDAFKFCAVEGDQVSIGIDADPARNLTPVNPAIFLFNEIGNQLFGFSDPAVTSNNTSGAGSLAATTPFSPGESIVWRARYTGVYYAGINPQAATSIPAASDYLVSIGLNCESASTFTATLDTDLTAEFPTVNGGDTFAYTISLSNSGAKTALEAEFVDVLPAAVTFLSLEGTGTDSAVCTQVPAPGSSGGTVRCRVDCLRPGGNFDFVITVRAPSCVGAVTLNNTVNVTSKTPVTPGSVMTDSVSVDVTDGCSDGLACTVGDHCEGTTCVATAPNDCNDSDPCTLDSCEEPSGCINSFSEGELCDDGDPCTSIDICLADPGGCVGFKPLGSPGEVTGVGFSDKTTLEWGSDAAAFTYDAVRGNVSALPVGPGGGDEICFDGISGTSTTDATLPGSGVGFWYLVRGENTCGAPAGTYGNATSGPRSTTTCP
jgi:uncharacterized repeat protein (TIGR01451 family)